MAKKNSGFTLIETLIYLALFGILVAGIGAATYAIVESAGRDQTRVTSQEEAGFLLGKLNWALSGASSITVTASSLTVNKFSFASNPLVFDLSANKLRLKEGAGTATDLNSDAVKVINLAFTDIPAAGGKPEGVTAAFTLRSTTPRGTTVDQDFQTTKYLR